MRIYEMTQSQLSDIYAACKEIPLIALQCGNPVTRQDMANIAWQKLGEEMGFNYLTVRPYGQDDRFFTAEPLALVNS